MSSTIPYQERTSAEAVGLAEEEVPVIVLPNGERLEFPGCRAYKMSLSELEEYEGRYEYWYGPTETLIVVADEPRVSGDHELPAPYLMQLVQQIADECGAHFIPFGTVSIWDANAEGIPRVVMRPDQCLYLRPQSARLPDKDGLKLGFHTLPDVVLEVDHTTDIRRGKLHQYALWGFPEVWVEVPEAYTPSRRAGKPRLTIYVLEGSQYREVAVSRARLRMVEAPRRYRYLHDAWSRRLVQRLDLPRPAVFFVEETLREPAFEAEAFGQANTRHTPWMRAAVWITRAAEDVGVVLAHELFHVLADLGRHESAPGNLMNERVAGGNTRLHDWQCERLRKVAAAFGLAVPVQ